MSAENTTTAPTTTTTETSTTTSTTPAVKVEINEVESKIIKQVEFYFSNSNLPRDNFLKGVYEAGNGMVDIGLIASFKRMQTLTTDVDVVKNALKKSQHLRMSDDGNQVGRVDPLPSMEELQNQKNIVHAKGFPLSYSLEDIENVFVCNGFKVNCVRIKKDENLNFKGSAWVELENEAQAEEATNKQMKITINQQLKKEEGAETQTENNEIVLTVLTKAQYFQKKKEEQNGGVDAKKGKKRKAEGEADRDRNTDEVENKIVLNRVLRLTNVAVETTREDLKDYINAFFDQAQTSASTSEDKKEGEENKEGEKDKKVGNTVAWVEFEKGNIVCTARLHENSQLTADELVNKINEAKKDLNGSVPAAEVVSGDEETEYWNNYFTSRSNRNKGGRRGGRGGRGGRRGGRGGRGGRRDRD